MEDNTSVSSITHEADIFERSVLFMVNLIKKNLRTLIAIGFFGGVIGYSISYLVPKQYTSKAELLPEYKESRFSSFSSLANLAGLDLSNSAGSEAVRPDLYPNILQSTPALLYLLKQPVVTSSKEKIPSLLAYLQKLNEKKENVKILEVTSDGPESSVLNFSKAEMNLIGNIKSCITSSFDKKTGIVSLKVEMRDPVVAATTLSHAIQYLTEYVSDYRLKKKHDQTQFIKTRVKEATKQLKNAEYTLQRYRDNNRNLIMNVAKIEEQKLQSDYLHAQNLRNDLMNQLEQATLTEKEGQAVIQVLEPPIVAIGKSSPSRVIYALITSAISVMLAVVIFSIFKRNN